MRTLDIPLLVVTLTLCGLGGLVLDSATAHQLSWSPEVVRQAAAMGVGLLVMLACWRIPPGTLRALAPFLYLCGVVGLILVRVPGIGQVSHGARRWIGLGPLGAFEPSEPAKLFLLLAVAALLTRRPDPSTRLSTALGALVLAAVPCALIVLQPDLGTAIVLCGTTVVMLIVSGASPVLLLALGTGGLAVAPFFMHDYQKARLMTYLNPQADPMGSGYNLLQAQTAVGSGQLFGSGLFAGPMSQHGFVPENWTDFIFTVVGEEMGFVGCIGFLALYALLIGLLLRTAMLARERFDMLLASGVAAMLALHVLVNVGMVLSLLPATGFPLPFASYGGSAVIVHMAALGLAMGVYRRYHEQNDDLWGIRTAGPLAGIP